MAERDERQEFADRLADLLRARLTNRGPRLSRPFARAFDIGGVARTESLRTVPLAEYDPVRILAVELAKTGAEPVLRDDGGLLIRIGGRDLVIWASTNAIPSLGGRPWPDEFAIGDPDGAPRLVTTSVEVLVEVLDALGYDPTGIRPDHGDPLVEVLAPGGYVTGRYDYVGNAKWGIHSEAIGDEWIDRAVDATRAAIRTAQEAR